MPRRPSLDRVLVVVKRTAYDFYVREYRMARVARLLREGDPVVSRLRRADREHHKTLDEVRHALDALGARAVFRDRANAGNTDAFDLVITVGGDGTLLSVSHATWRTPVLGVNSAPQDSVGFLCSTRAGRVRRYLADYAKGLVPRIQLARMAVSVDGKRVHSRVLNDVLFAHTSPAMTTRYFLVTRGGREEQKSSGLWVGPATGSTAAIHSAGGRVLPPRSRNLQFVVREPYTPTGRPFRYTQGIVRPGERFEVWNKMREARLYLDGPRNVVPLTIGQRVSFEVSDEPLTMVGVHRHPSGPNAR